MKLTRRAALALVPFVLAPLARAQQSDSHDAHADILAKIEAIRAEAKVPALGAALVTADHGLEDVWVTGTRRAGGTELATENDLWHLGSCTKSMTATLIALLVARGDLKWDALLGDLLPKIAEDMNPD